MPWPFFPRPTPGTQDPTPRPAPGVPGNREAPVEPPARKSIDILTDIDGLRVVADIIPVGRPNRPGKSMVPQFVTVHDTANTRRDGDALGHARYLRSDEALQAKVSWHYTVDDHMAVQHLPLNETGFHAGDGGDGPGNSTSIGIEICENAGGNRMAAETNAMKLIARLLREFDLDWSRVVPHKHWSGKECPRHLLSRWGAFIAQAEQMGGPIKA